MAKAVTGRPSTLIIARPTFGPLTTPVALGYLLYKPSACPEVIMNAVLGATAAFVMVLVQVSTAQPTLDGHFWVAIHQDHDPTTATALKGSIATGMLLGAGAVMQSLCERAWDPRGGICDARVIAKRYLNGVTAQDLTQGLDKFFADPQQRSTAIAVAAARARWRARVSPL